jgi:DNA mismatch repair ATPase MutL
VNLRSMSSLPMLIRCSTEKKSHPTGTTIRVKDFLKNVPVRRQTALKTTQKTINKIRKTLQAYAIARPNTRLFLKILRSQSDSGNWTYGPSSNAGMAEAALKVVGRDVAGQCIERSWPPSDEISSIEGSQSSSIMNGSQRSDATYAIYALIPTPESGECCLEASASTLLTEF